MGVMAHDSSPYRAATKRKAAQAAPTVSVLPMELQIGDVYTDAQGEWEIIARPVVMQRGKSLRAKIRRTTPPVAEGEMVWPVHLRVEIRRRAR